MPRINKRVDTVYNLPFEDFINKLYRLDESMNKEGITDIQVSLTNDQGHLLLHGEELTEEDIRAKIVEEAVGATLGEQSEDFNELKRLCLQLKGLETSLKVMRDIEDSKEETLADIMDASEPTDKKPPIKDAPPPLTMYEPDDIRILED